jgi:proline iminopeptidase
MRATVDGTALFFDVVGGGLEVDVDRLRARPTIVVVHGGPGFDHSYLWAGLAPLADEAQLVFVDLRGQGRSAPVPVESVTLERMADDVAALCELLGIERPIVFGHSAGGFVALHLALRHPHVAGGLILCATSPGFVPLPDDDVPPGPLERGGREAAVAAQRLFAGDLSPDVQEAFGRLVAPLYSGPTHEDVPARLFALTRLDADIAGHFFRQEAARYDLRARLAEIAVPTLVLAGGADWVCPPAASRLLAAAIPDTELVEIDGAGHFLFSEEPADFLHAVRAFVGGYVAVS